MTRADENEIREWLRSRYRAGRAPLGGKSENEALGFCTLRIWQDLHIAVSTIQLDGLLPRMGYACAKRVQAAKITIGDARTSASWTTGREVTRYEIVRKREAGNVAKQVQDNDAAPALLAAARKSANAERVSSAESSGLRKFIRAA